MDGNGKCRERRCRVRIMRAPKAPNALRLWDVTIERFRSSSRIIADGGAPDAPQGGDRRGGSALRSEMEHTTRLDIGSRDTCTEYITSRGRFMP